MQSAKRRIFYVGSAAGISLTIRMSLKSNIDNPKTLNLALGDKAKDCVKQSEPPEVTQLPGEPVTAVDCRAVGGGRFIQVSAYGESGPLGGVRRESEPWSS